MEWGVVRWVGVGWGPTCSGHSAWLFTTGTQPHPGFAKPARSQLRLGTVGEQPTSRAGWDPGWGRCTCRLCILTAIKSVSETFHFAIIQILSYSPACAVHRSTPCARSPCLIYFIFYFGLIAAAVLTSPAPPAPHHHPITVPRPPTFDVPRPQMETKFGVMKAAIFHRTGYDVLPPRQPSK